MKKACILALTLFGVLAIVSAEGSIPLRGLLLLAGEPGPGLEVVLRGADGASTATVTDAEGKFVFKVRPGIYSLSAGLPGYYRAIVEGIAIEKEPVDEVVLTLPRQLAFESPEPFIIGPEILDAPEVELVFEPEGPMIRNHVLAARITIRNVGETEVSVPTDPVTGEDAAVDTGLRMNLVVEGYGGLFNGWYACRPAECPSLKPGEKIQIRISRLTSRENRDRPVAYDREGSFPIGVAISFIPANRPNARTRAVQIEYLLTVPPGTLQEPGE